MQVKHNAWFVKQKTESTRQSSIAFLIPSHFQSPICGLHGMVFIFGLDPSPDQTFQSGDLLVLMRSLSCSEAIAMIPATIGISSESDLDLIENSGREVDTGPYYDFDMIVWVTF